MATTTANVLGGAITLPFQPSIGNYNFTSTINNIPYNFNVLWNTRDEDPDNGIAGAWYFDVLDSSFNPIITGVKIVLGAFLGRLCSDPLFTTGCFVAIDTSGNEQEAGYDDIGMNPDGTTNRVVVKWIPVLELQYQKIQAVVAAASS